MALPTFTVGQVLTAADTNQYLVNTIIARKTADESVTSSTTLQDDDHLTVSVLANATYEFLAFIRYDGQPAADLKFQFVGPAGATLFGAVHHLITAAGSSADTALDSLALSSTVVAGTLAAGSANNLFCHGNLVIAGTAGTFKLQWAQNVSDATAVKIQASSFFTLRQIL